LLGCFFGILLAVGGGALGLFYLFRMSQGQGLNIGPLPLGPKPFTQEKTVEAPLTAVTALQICNMLGNVSVEVDAQTKKPVIATTKHVQATDEKEAQKKFNDIKIEVLPPDQESKQLTCSKQLKDLGQQPDPNSTLTVNTIIPNSHELLRTTNDSVDITIKLPTTQPGNSNALPLQLNLEAPAGNIHIVGVLGLMRVHGSAGNISIERSVLGNGSKIDTGQGNVTFSGLLEMPFNEQQKEKYHYYITAEKGDVTVSLPESMKNITLDSNVNVGTIQSDFPLRSLTREDEGAHYYGPLNEAAGAPVPVILTLNASTGKVEIRKATEPVGQVIRSGFYFVPG
jgi:hypothetical protein